MYLQNKQLLISAREIHNPHMHQSTESKLTKQPETLEIYEI